MATAKSFEELEVWKNARALASDIYKSTSSGLFSRDFGLREQIRRAAVSIVSNIAEGFERGGNREFIHFLYMAKGSAAELRAQLYIASDLKYLASSDFLRLNNQVTTVARQISALIQYLERYKAGTGDNARTRRTQNLQPSTFNL